MPGRSGRRGSRPIKEGHVCKKDKIIIYCSGRYAITGHNDLLTVRPDLVEEWDYSRNQKICPQQLTINAHNKVWWKCKKGINGELPSIAEPMVQDVHIVREKLLLRLTLLLDGE